jgi:hypothetical protein
MWRIVYQKKENNKLYIHDFNRLRMAVRAYISKKFDDDIEFVRFGRS